jgi:hypothetical protein
MAGFQTEARSVAKYLRLAEPPVKSRDAAQVRQCEKQVKVGKSQE